MRILKRLLRKGKEDVYERERKKDSDATLP